MIHAIRDFMQAISDRDITFNPPAAPVDIQSLETFLTRNLGSNFLELYSHCNGFIDAHSYISIWTIEHIIKNKSSGNVIENFTIIGDILMESDYIIANLSENDAPIKFLYENTSLSHNIQEFLDNIASGRLDFPWIVDKTSPLVDGPGSARCIRRH